jgi:predicted transcriptional regulator
MSFTALQWAFKQRCGSVTQQMILTALANYANENGVCWPSKSKLAEVCRLSKAAVCSNLNVLAEQGLIAVEMRGGEKGKSRQTSSLITLKMDTACLVDGRSDVQQEDTRSVQQKDKYKNLSDTNQSEEPVTDTAAALEAEFEEFWAAYPKRPINPKHPARLKFHHARRLLNVQCETLVNAAKAYAATRAGKDPAYTAQAVTWLNQRRWEEGEDPTPSLAEADKVGLMGKIAKLVAAYPGAISSLEAVMAAFQQGRQVGEIDEIIEAVEKYALLLKQRRGEGFSVSPPTLEYFLRFKWRDMNAYEFYHPGMAGKKAVRPKRERTSA